MECQICHKIYQKQNGLTLHLKIKHQISSNQNQFKNHFETILYNNEQHEFIQSPLTNSSLYGIPGGGKTQSIIGKIIHHFNNNDFTSKSNFMVLTFSKRATKDFINKGKKYDTKIFNQSTIKTIHSLAASLIKYVFNKTSIHLKTIMVSAYLLFDQYHDKIKEYKKLANCKIIFIDEAQDLSDIEYKLIIKISEFFNIPVIMVGDPNQNIYQFKFGSDKYLLNHQGPKYFLVKNYRSVPNIVNLINNIRPLGNLTPLIEPIRSETEFKPVLVIDEIPNIIDHIIDTIKTLNIPYHKMAILGPVKRSKPSDIVYINIGLSLIINALVKHQIPFVKHYSDGDNNDDLNHEIEFQENAVNVTTIHGSKGLEFDVVFLVNFHYHTFGRRPSPEDYIHFKHLWYVGLSRAKDLMYLYTDKSKFIWPDYKHIINDLTVIGQKPKILKNLNYGQNDKPIIYSVTELLTNQKYVSDNDFYLFKQLIGELDICVEPIWKHHQYDLEFFQAQKGDQLRIYGKFIENIFDYYYSKVHQMEVHFLKKLKSKISHQIVIPHQYVSGYIKLKSKLGHIIKEEINLSTIVKYKLNFDICVLDLINYLQNILNNDYEKMFYLITDNDVVLHPITKILSEIDIIEKEQLNETNVHHAIYYLTVYEYQVENETCYMLDQNFEQDIEKLEPFIDQIKEYVLTIDEKFDFQIKLMHPNLPILGIVDLINDTKIIDLKFSYTDFVGQYYDQIIFYYLLYDTSMTRDVELEIWNLLKGEKVRISFDKLNVDRKKVLMMLSKFVEKKLENMVFFYDLETTGLITENNYPDIIEIYLEEYQSKSVWCNHLVKLETIDQLDSCITSITGITDNDLMTSGVNLKEIYGELEELMNYCQNPIFVAHNGNAFDHKIMTHLKLFKDQTLKLDSRIFFGFLIGNNTAGSLKLVDLYNYYYTDPVRAHRAEADVYMMIKICEKLNLNYQKLIGMI